MKRSQVTAAAVSGLGLVVVIVVAIGLNLVVIRAGRSSVEAASVAAPTTTTQALPTVVTVYVDDPVPILVHPNTFAGSSTVPPSEDNVTTSVSTPTTEVDEQAPEVITSESELGPPTATSAPTATSVSTSPPATSTPSAPTTPTTVGTTTTTTTVPSSSTTTVPAPASLMIFDLPRQAGTATITVGSSSLTLDNVQLASGWHYSCESPYGREIQLQMSGPASRYEFTIKLESGRVFTEGG